MLRILAIAFGCIMVSFGVMGFIPAYLENGKLFNLFQVNFEHNIAHLSTGILALLCGISSSVASSSFFLICGAVYTLLALTGFQIGEGMLFDMIAVNMLDNYVHAGIAVFCFAVGFGFNQI